VGLLDLTVPSRSSQKYTNQLLANDISIEQAVQGIHHPHAHPRILVRLSGIFPTLCAAVGETLFVYLHEEEGARGAKAGQGPGPELRCYLSELYGQFWDVCYLHRNLQLDVQILYDEQAALPQPRTTPRDQLLLRPELQVCVCVCVCVFDVLGAC
jgi:hypothetical protein